MLLKYHMLFITTFVPLVVFSQLDKGKAVYAIKTEFRFSSTSKKEELAILRKMFAESELSSSVRFELLFNKNEALFYGVSQMKASTKYLIDMAKTEVRLVGKMYTNRSEGLFLQQKERYGDIYLIKKTNDFNKPQWELMKDTMRIGDYLCYKAVLKKSPLNTHEITAWYTPEIPINIGPLGYSGLPGFIVMLKNNLFVYLLQSVEFSDKWDKQLKKPTKGRLVSPDEYDSITKVLRKKMDDLQREGY